MAYNARVKTFVAGAVTFTCSTANGVYVERGAAGGPGVVDRIVVTGAGVVHDMDGTADGVLVPPVIWQEITFQAAHPNGHTQYWNLLKCVGKHGTLTLTIPTASGEVTQSVAARLLPLDGQWEAPYRAGVQNWFTVRAEWQLKALLTVA